MGTVQVAHLVVHGSKPSHGVGSNCMVHERRREQLQRVFHVDRRPAFQKLQGLPLLCGLFPHDGFEELVQRLGMPCFSLQAPSRPRERDSSDGGPGGCHEPDA